MDKYEMLGIDRNIRDDIAYLDGIRIYGEDSARDALADVLLSVNEMNRLLAEARPGDLRTGGILESLKKWLRKLTDKLQEITAAVRGSSFGVSVGAPISVSVTVSFARPALPASRPLPAAASA